MRILVLIGPQDLGSLLIIILCYVIVRWDPRREALIDRQTFRVVVRLKGRRTYNRKMVGQRLPSP